MSEIALRTVFLTEIACMLTGFVFGTLSFAAFDRLLRRVWAESEEAWIKLGKPCGFFWVPRGTRVGFMTSFVRGDLYEKWAAMGEVPAAGCANDLGKLRRYRRIARWCFAAWVLLLLSFLAGVFGPSLF